MLLAFLIELRSDVPSIRIQLNDRVQIEPFVDQLNSAQIDVEQLLRAELMRRHEPLQCLDALLGDTATIAAERIEILRADCVVGALSVGSERRESRASGSQCAGLEKRAAIEIGLRLGFLATPLRLFCVFHGLLPRDEEHCLYSVRHDENIRAL